MCKSIDVGFADLHYMSDVILQNIKNFKWEVLQMKMLFLGGSIGICEMILYAKSLGIYTIVTDWIDLKHSKAKETADEFWMISLADLNQLERKCREVKIDAVTTASSDFAVEVLIELCARLKLPCYITKESFYYEKNKAAFKKVCKEVGVQVPEDYRFTPELLDKNQLNIKFPVVVKPVDCSASRGITYCYNNADLYNAYCKVKEVSSNADIIVERKIIGKEFVAYYALAEGSASLILIQSVNPANKKIPSACAVGSNVADCLELFLKKANLKIIQVLDRCQCRNHIAWIQFMIDEDGEIYVIEMGHRPGGDMISIEYSMSNHFNIYQWGVECALGKKHTKEDLPKSLSKAPEEYIYSYMLCSKKGGTIHTIKGFDKFDEMNNVDIFLNVCLGDVVPDKDKGLGYIGFHASSIDELCTLIYEVNRGIRIEDENGENILWEYMPLERFCDEEINWISK